MMRSDQPAGLCRQLRSLALPARSWKSSSSHGAILITLTPPPFPGLLPPPCLPPSVPSPRTPQHIQTCLSLLLLLATGRFFFAASSHFKSATSPSVSLFYFFLSNVTRRLPGLRSLSSLQVQLPPSMSGMLR